MKAIALRKEGYTYKEIREIIPRLSKGTLSGWCSRLDLTSKEISRIKERMQKGINRARFQSIMTHRKMREERDEKTKKIAQKEYEKFKDDPLFNFGLALYWAEGSKKTRQFQFTNSDQRLAVIMLEWLAKYLQIDKNGVKVRVYIHKIYEEENCEEFWASAITIPRQKFMKTVYKPTRHLIKKNPDYKGCLRIDAGTVVTWVKINEWQNCFYKERAYSSTG